MLACREKTYPEVDHRCGAIVRVAANLHDAFGEQEDIAGDTMGTCPERSEEDATVGRLECGLSINQWGADEQEEQQQHPGWRG